MSKQDGVSPRSASDLERKYSFGRSFAEAFDIALDARDHAFMAEEAVEKLTLVVSGLSVTVEEISENSVTKSQLTQTAEEIKASVKEELGEDFATKSELTVTTEGISARIETVEGNVSSLEGELSTTKKSVSDLTVAQDSITARVETTETKLTGVEGEIGTIKSTYATKSELSVQSDSITARVEATETKVTGIEGDLSTATGDITTLKSQVSELSVDKDSITARVETVEGSLESLGETYATKAELELKVDADKMISMINMAANEITITSDNFKLTAKGEIEAKAGKIAEWNIGSSLSGSYSESGIGYDGIEWEATMTTKLARPITSETHILSVTCDKQKGLDSEATYSSREVAYIAADGTFCSQEIYYHSDGEPNVVENPRKVILTRGHIAVVGSNEDDKYELMYYNHPSFTATYVIYIDPADNVVKASMAYG